MPPSVEFANVGPLIAPRSIAVVGASDSPGNLGGVAVGFLTKFGFPGPVYPVNPGREHVRGIACHQSVAALPQPPDLAIIAVASAQVARAVRECAEAGIRFGIVWAGGFAEIGDTGVHAQAALVETCRETGFTLLGPNCIGVINSWLPMPATFASFLLEAETLSRGSISMVSQSGGIATMAQALAQQDGSGFRTMASVGNEAMLTLADFIHAFAADPGTRVIAVYLEGVRDGDKFVAALTEARAAGKPVVILKGGMSAASARAAAAHTGALAGEGRVWEAVLGEEAAVVTESLEEMLDVALFLSTTDLDKLPGGNGVAVVTFGGGGGVLAADQCAKRGLATPAISEESQERLRPLLPPIAAIGNPFDVTPQTFNQAEWMEKFPSALDVIAGDEAIHAILIQNGPMSHKAFELADAVANFRDRTGKTVSLAWPLAPAGAAERSRSNGFHVFGEFARAINALAKATRYRADRARWRDPEPPAPIGVDWGALVPEARAGRIVSEHECHAILRAAGLPVAAGELATCENAAVAAAARIGFPLVMKGITPKVTHRAKAGLVVLDIRSPDDARATFRLLSERAEEAGTPLHGVYLQQMAGRGREVLVSAFRDPVFGPMVSCGSGGVLTELLDDVVIARAPIGERMSEELLARLRIARHPDASLAPLSAFVSRFSRLAASAPWRGFTLEVNPVVWNEEGALAVDGLLIIEEP